MEEIPKQRMLEVYEEFIGFQRKDIFFQLHEEALAKIAIILSGSSYMDFSRGVIDSTELHTLVMHLFPRGFSNNSRILQIGCNYGPYLRFLASKSEEWNVKLKLMGIDLAADSVEFGKKYGGLDLRVMDALDMNEIPSNSQDFVLSDSFIDETYLSFLDREKHHVPSDKKLNSAIQETYRVLARRGKLLINAYILDPTRLTSVGYEVTTYFIRKESEKIPSFERLYVAQKK